MQRIKSHLQPILFSSIALLGIALMSSSFFLKREKLQCVDPVFLTEKVTEIRKEQRQAYGLNLDRMDVCVDYVRKNQFLSEILMQYNVPYELIDHIAKRTKDVFDVRHLRVGNKYCIVLDTTHQHPVPRHFIYEDSKYEYIVYTFENDSVLAKREKKPIEFRIREASGVINSSLYATLQETGLDPNLAIRLSEIYAWTIDFYRLQKGDRFKIIFDEEYVDNVYAGIGNIDAVLFNHMNQDLYGFYFESDSIRYGDYYDESGKSLRKAFLTAPVKFTRISSKYTMRRYHPVQKRYKAHLGTDYAAPRGTPIYATADGVVTHAKYSRYNGNYVKVRHNGTYTTQYLHMNSIARGMKPGVFVKQGQIIGYVGSTGLATGPHVCYRFWKNGQQVDPYKQKLPEAEPIKESLREAYNSKKDVMKKELDLIQYPEQESEKEDQKDELAMVTHS